MNEISIKKQQIDFYKSGKAGYMFAALAAKDPKKFEWKQVVLNSSMPKQIDEVIESCLEKDGVSTLSIIFPKVRTLYELCTFIANLDKCKNIIIENNIHDEHDCFGIRVKCGDKLSWVTGFGPFLFFPETRISPHTEISFRIKPKPHYDSEMKKSPEDVLHLAHMDMKGMQKEQFQQIWHSSLRKTEKMLGHKPDFLSAAKTTFSIPWASNYASVA